MVNYPCSATLWVGNQKIQCTLPVVGTGPIVDEITGERAAPFQHFIGNHQHTSYVNNIFSDECGHLVHAVVKWSGA